MRLAIAAAKANPFYPFGAVIIGAADRAVLAQGVNNRADIVNSSPNQSCAARSHMLGAHH